MREKSEVFESIVSAFLRGAGGGRDAAVDEEAETALEPAAAAAKIAVIEGDAEGDNSAPASTNDDAWT